MSPVPVAAEYIALHRGESTDLEIARALRDQGFSEETLTAAFRAAGERPAELAGSPHERAFNALLVASAALLLLGSALLFVSDFRQANRSAAEDAVP